MVVVGSSKTVPERVRFWPIREERSRFELMRGEARVLIRKKPPQKARKRKIGWGFRIARRRKIRARRKKRKELKRREKSGESRRIRSPKMIPSVKRRREKER